MPQNNSREQNSSDFTLKNLPKPQKTAVIFLFILAILVVVFWIIQMRSHINQPFNYGDFSEGVTSDSAQALKDSDTDNDGLSDYDEIYIYKTSPYLEDSDSDSLTDNQEVAQNTDPNCPQGKDCNSSESSPIIPSSSTSSSNNILNNSDTSNLDASSLNESTLQQALSGSIDAASLRQLLIESGANESDLNQISDEDLMKSYQETLANQSLNTQ